MFKNPALRAWLPFAIFGLLALLVFCIDIAFGYGGFSSYPGTIRSLPNTIWFAESIAVIGTGCIMFCLRKRLPDALPWIVAGVAVALFCLWVLGIAAVRGRLWPDEFVTHFWEQIYGALHLAVGSGTPLRSLGGYLMFSYNAIFAVTQLVIIVPLVAAYFYLRKQH